MKKVKVLLKSIWVQLTSSISLEYNGCQGFIQKSKTFSLVHHILSSQHLPLSFPPLLTQHSPWRHMESVLRDNGSVVTGLCCTDQRVAPRWALSRCHYRALRCPEIPEKYMLSKCGSCVPRCGAGGAAWSADIRGAFSAENLGQW